MNHRIIKSALALLLALLTVAAVEYSVTVKQIEVWVKVTDKSGNSVAGLKQDDFEIYEDDQKMPVGCFEESTVALPNAPGGVAETQAAAEEKSIQAPKKFVLFLDLLNTSQAEYTYVRPKLEEFLNQIANKGWEVMLSALMPSGKLGVISPFTTDLDRIHSLVDEAAGNGKRDLAETRSVKELQEYLVDNCTGKADCLQTAVSLARKDVRDEQKESLFSLDALDSFSNYLNANTKNERTVILYVSGGFNSDPGRRYFDMIEKFVGGTLSSNAATDGSGNLQGAISDTNFDFQRTVENRIGRLNRLNITLYAINTRGNKSGSGSGDVSLSFTYQDNQTLKDYQDSLARIAEETGGISFENSNNFKVGFDQVFKDLDHQYLLCFNAPEHKKAGEYHKIKVVSKRPDVTLRYRQGYVD